MPAKSLSRTISRLSSLPVAVPRATMAMAEKKIRQEELSSNNEQGLPQKTRHAVKGFPPFPMSQKAPRRPSAEEMIEYYTRKGLDKQAATEKVIEDLQKALTIAVSRFPQNAQEVEKPGRSVSGTLESISTRLSTVEAKVDEKPDSGGVFTAGVAAGGFLQAVPHVFRAMSQVSRSLKDAISSRP